MRVGEGRVEERTDQGALQIIEEDPAHLRLSHTATTTYNHLPGLQCVSEMKSFINSSSESDSEEEPLGRLTRREDGCEESGQTRGQSQGSSNLEERKKPPRQSVFEYMSQQKVIIHGAADLDEHIHSNLPSAPELFQSPLKKRRKTFYDSSDDEEEEQTNCLTTPQSGLVVGDLLAKYSPQVSPSGTNSDRNSVATAAEEDLDVWLESPQKQSVEDSSSTATANRKRKVARQAVDWSSSDGETEEVRPQLTTVAPVRELASVTLSSCSDKGPNDDQANSPPSPSPPTINKYAAQYLKDYQIQGVQWMYQKYSCKAGCILGYCLYSSLLPM